jgi:hypothetical protein
MGEAFSRLVEKLADMVADEQQIITRTENVCSLMKTMKLTKEQALDALLVRSDERKIIEERLRRLENGNVHNN